MNASRCFVCSEPGHKAIQCPAKRRNKKNDKAETLATSFRSRSRSPVVRCSNDDEESTHSAGDTSENNKSNTKLDFKTNLYIGNLPKDWSPSKIKDFILENVDQALINTNIFVMSLKDKNLKETGCAKIRVDKETAETLGKTLRNIVCEGKNLLATVHSNAPFLDNLLLTKQSVAWAKELQWRKHCRNRFPEIQKSENKFEINTNKEDSDYKNVYGLSRNFLKALDITPPLRNSVFVANFDCEKVNQEKLREIFSLAGQVVSVYIFRNSDGTPKKCARVTFDHPIEAVQAISMFHNQSLYDQHLVIKMDSTKKNFEPALPDGIKKIGPGLGPGGKPMRSVRNTIEWEPLKHLLLEELSKLKADSVSNLEESISRNSFFHQNVPIVPNYAMGGAEQMAVNPMALNTVINQIAQNAAMNIMSQTPGINSMTQNASMNAMAQNAAMNPMAQNVAINAMTQNAAINAMAQNVDPNLMARNNLNLMAQNPNMMGMTSLSHETQSGMQQANMMANMQGYQQQVVTHAQNRGEWNMGTGYVGNSSGTSQQREYVYNPSNVTESRGRGDSDVKDNTGESRSHMLLFTNLPYSVDQESLASKMREIGKLKFIELTGQGRAIMSFEKYTDAERCVNLFHRCKVDGQIIEVKFF